MWDRDRQPAGVEADKKIRFGKNVVHVQQMQKSTTGRMTLFSESGILSVKTGGQREIAQMEEQEKQRLIEIAGRYEDCVYIEVSSVQSGSTLVYHLGDAVGIVKPGVHIGMFQDSVLYMKYATEEDPCALDFRYFPKGFGDVMETYSWSGNQTQVIGSIAQDAE